MTGNGKPEEYVTVQVRNLEPIYFDDIWDSYQNPEAPNKCPDYMIVVDTSEPWNIHAVFKRVEYVRLVGKTIRIVTEIGTIEMERFPEDYLCPSYSIGFQNYVLIGFLSRIDGDLEMPDDEAKEMERFEDE